MNVCVALELIAFTLKFNVFFCVKYNKVQPYVQITNNIIQQLLTLLVLDSVSQHCI